VSRAASIAPPAVALPPSRSVCGPSAGHVPRVRADVEGQAWPGMGSLSVKRIRESRRRRPNKQRPTENRGGISTPATTTTTTTKTTISTGADPNSISPLRRFLSLLFAPRRARDAGERSLRAPPAGRSLGGGGKREGRRVRPSRTMIGGLPHGVLTI